MKLCFSTLGCPGWSWKDVIIAAKDIGMDGVEVRCVGNHLHATNSAEFKPDNIAATMETLARMGLSIPCFDSNAVFAVPEKEESARAQAKAYIDLAAAAGTKYVRFMSVGVPEPVECDLELCARIYDDMCAYGADKGVTPLMETNGLLADSAMMMKFMDGIKSENKGVLWDVHHPFRYYGETPEQTYAMIKPLLRHVHIKDSVVRDGKIIYRMMGKGDIPVKQTMLLLLDNGYDGFVSLEWVKKWQPDLEDAGVVFPNFASYAHRVIASYNK